MKTLANSKFFDKKAVDITEMLFKIIFLFYAALSYCSVTYGHAVISVLMWITAALGAIVLLQRIVLFKEHKGMPMILPCIAIILCMGVSILVNFSYDLKLNVVLLGYFAFYLFICFTHNQNKTAEKLKGEIHFYSWVFIIYTTIAIIASFVVMFAGFSSIRHVNADNFEVVTGFKFGRLWGIFLGPNGGAIVSLVSIAMMFGFILKNKKFLFRFLLSVNIILHMLYVTFSDSRTALVCIIAVPVLTALIYAMGSDKQKKLRFVKPVLVSILATVLCVTFVYSSKHLYNYVITRINSSSQGSADGEQDSTDLNAIDRGYNLEDDYSNRRFDLWKSGFEVFKDSFKNITIGTTYYGMRLYSYEHLPDTYLVNNTQTDFANFHNEFINVLVAQGVLGFAAVIWLMAAIIIFVIKNIKNLDSSSLPEFTTAVAIILLSVLASMFIPGVFYLFSPSSIIFWIFLGYAVMLLKKGTNQEA